MKTSKINDERNQLKTKEQLLELLNEYRGILKDSMINYLKSLIELEFSVIKNYINDSDRKAMAELEIYKKVAIYNIYNRVKNLFRQKNDEFNIVMKYIERNESFIASTELSDRSIKLFDFDYQEIHSTGWNTPKIPDGFKTLNIGNVSSYQTIESQELKEAELNRIMKILEKLYDEENPYSSRPGIIGGPGTTWIFDHTKKIQAYEERFKQLDSKKELSDEDKKEIEITNNFHDLLLEEFGLTNNDFVDETINSFANFDTEKTELEKTLVKKMPNLTIKNNIRYI